MEEMREYQCVLCHMFFNGTRFSESDEKRMKEAFSNFGIDIDNHNTPVAVCFDCYGVFDRLAKKILKHIEECNKGTRCEFCYGYISGCLGNEKGMEN